MFFAARAAVEALAGDYEVMSSLGFILVLIRTGAPATAEYDKQVQSRGIRCHNLNAIPDVSELADLRGQGGQVDLRIARAAELQRDFNIEPAR